MNKFGLSILIPFFVTILLFQNTYAHGFGERYDLPLPLYMFIVGGAVTVAVSFLLVSFFMKFESSISRNFTFVFLDLSKFGRLRISKLLIFLIKVLSVLIYFLIILTGIFGIQKPLENFSVVFVWIVWWVGIGYLVAFVLNIWDILNPWSIIYDWIFKPILKIFNISSSGIYSYDFRRYDVLPALVMFVIFCWVENVYSNTDSPAFIAFLILGYSLVTFCGMFLYGSKNWLNYGEIFSVLFGYYSKFSALNFNRDVAGKLSMTLRPYGFGLIESKSSSIYTTFLIIVVLSMVTFDGLSETPFWVSMLNFFYPFFVTILGEYTIIILTTIGMLIVPAVFMFLYFLTCYFMLKCAKFNEIEFNNWNEKDFLQIGNIFIFTLIPIALAYNLAHYFSFLLIQGQLIIPLISDPFGFGWDIFSTANYKVNIAIINAKFAWFLSLFSIVIGHILSIFIAHKVAFNQLKNIHVVLKTQYPMLVLMVIYTATSLWIIAQPIVEMS
ncbi:MAG: hypothetical protein FI687_05130 [SAR202 cluster bacterium]|nr:hypothetical protein [SAR202 cluster bacterium]|tara:strand:- start:52719 stop:54209 length:1491 start_codon:yes stop_codon:yes gene_type:complete